MSIDHKAYLFRYDEFQEELADLLYRCLRTGKIDSLRGFINANRAALTDLATAMPLTENWQERVREMNVQYYADLALTKYYDLTASLGLSHGFIALGAYLRSVARLSRYADDLICGRFFGPRGKRLDPGNMGTGLASAKEAARFAKLLASVSWPAIPGPEADIYAECYYQPESAEEVENSGDQLVALYRRAANARTGILFVDFNDGGVRDL
jgi:hypothetical protein